MFFFSATYFFSQPHMFFFLSHIFFFLSHICFFFLSHICFFLSHIYFFSQPHMFFSQPHMFFFSHICFFLRHICFFSATYVLQRKFTFKATERLNFQRAGEVPVVLVCSLEGVGGGLEAWIGWVGGAHWGDLEAWIVGNWCRRKVATATTHTTKSWHQDISKLSL